jgi:hypothetical protein
MNRRLLIGFWVFVIVAFVGLLLALSALERHPREEAAIDAARQATITSILLTNTHAITWGPAIETAKAWTPTASPTRKIAQAATSGK